MSCKDQRQISISMHRPEWSDTVYVPRSGTLCQYIRARNGNKLYQLGEGPDQGVKTVRVLTGYESPDGKLDPEHARGFWFDPNGKLVQAFFNGLQTRRSDFEDFAEVKVAHRIDVLRDGALAMRIQVTNISPAGVVPEKTFELKGHEWTRAFTSEVR